MNNSVQLPRQDLTLTTSDIEMLNNLILDAYNGEHDNHPIVSFLSTTLDYPADSIFDLFEYYKVFNKPPKTRIAAKIIESREGFEFWAELFNCYNNRDMANGLKKMIEVLTTVSN